MKTIAALLALLTALSCAAQNDYAEYMRTVRQADSLYNAKQYAESATLYASINSMQLGSEPINDPWAHYNAACSWALANQPEKAFSELHVLIHKKHFTEREQLEKDADFESIRSDGRWMQLLKAVDANIERQQRIDARIEVPEEWNNVVFYPLSEQVQRFVHNDSLPFVSLNCEGYRVYCRANSFAAQHWEEIRAELNHSRQRSLEVLGISSYQRGITIVFVDSREEMKELTGRSIFGGFAMAEHDFVILNHNATKYAPPITHEIYHAISLQAWGICPDPLLIEGSATYAQNECSNAVENPILSINAYLLQTKQLIPLSDLVRDFRAAAATHEIEAYLQGAGIFKYLRETRDLNQLEQLWSRGFAHFEEIYGQSLDAFEAEWLSYIAQQPVPADADWDTILTRGCQQIKPVQH